MSGCLSLKGIFKLVLEADLTIGTYQFECGLGLVEFMKRKACVCVSRGPPWRVSASGGKDLRSLK
jgi:uncharacterized protein YjhX (UPF0386 family)